MGYFLIFGELHEAHYFLSDQKGFRFCKELWHFSFRFGNGADLEQKVLEP